MHQWFIGFPEERIIALKDWPNMQRKGKSGYYHRKGIVDCFFRYKSANKENEFWAKYDLMKYGDARVKCPKDKSC